jgi:hypothetical protein
LLFRGCKRFTISHPGTLREYGPAIRSISFFKADWIDTPSDFGCTPAAQPDIRVIKTAI